MRLLLDTNVVIMLIEGGARLSPTMLGELVDRQSILFVSAVSLWEMAIKHRSGKLTLAFDPSVLQARLGSLGISVLPLSPVHAVADAQLAKEHKDPFDRMIAAVAEIEVMVMVTTDAKLIDHPLAWRP